MKERFEGPEGSDGRRRLVDALLRQTAVNGDRGIAEAVADECTLIELPADAVFIEQDGWETDVFFILNGSVSVEIHGFRIATRSARTHVGEMAAIDPAARRSATVRTIDSVVLAMLTEPQLEALAARFPDIWRRFAVEVSDRLRQRSRFVRVPNQSPNVFIGSSSEQLPIAEAIQAGLGLDDANVQLWTQGIFNPTQSTLADLIKTTERVDFAVLLVTPDDIVRRRRRQTAAPRDNVILEVGIDTGVLHVARTGIRGSNDLVWVGRAANYAAKLCDLRVENYASWITADVYDRMNDEAKYRSSDGAPRWEKRTWTKYGITIYRSNWWWKP